MWNLSLVDMGAIPYQLERKTSLKSRLGYYIRTGLPINQDSDFGLHKRANDINHRYKRVLPIVMPISARNQSFNIQTPFILTFKVHIYLRIAVAQTPLSHSNEFGMERLLHILPVQVFGSILLRTDISLNAICLRL